MDSYGPHKWCINRGGSHLASGSGTVTMGLLIMWDVHGNITCDVKNTFWIILKISVICFFLFVCFPFFFSFGRMYERVCGCGCEWKYIGHDRTFWLSGLYAILIFVICLQVNVLQYHTNLSINNILDGYDDPYKIYKASHGNS